MVRTTKKKDTTDAALAGSTSESTASTDYLNDALVVQGANIMPGANPDDGGPDGDADVAGNPVPYITAAPAVPPECIADLTVAGGASRLDDEEIQYIKLNAGGELWLDLHDLDPGARDKIKTTLATACAAKDFDPATSFTRDGDRIVLGGSTTSFDFDADTSSAQAVLDRSNNTGGYKNADDAEIWKFLNGDSKAVDREDAPDAERVGPDATPDKKKPAAWYNGYVIKGDKVVPVRSDWDDRDGPLPPTLTLAQYQEMLQRDFNVDGAIDKLEGLGGEKAFVAAMTARFGKGHPLGPDAFEALCREVYSYATTGAGSDGTTDIAMMQAMLKQLSPDIADSNDSNTPLSGAPFKIPGTDVEINRGDGKHGRATVMETRHLLAGIMTELTGPQSIPLTQGEELIGERDYFVTDDSQSMKEQWDGLAAFTDAQKGWGEGEGMESRRLGTIGIFENSVRAESATDDMKRQQSAGKDSNTHASTISSFDDVLLTAYELLAPGRTPSEAKKFGSYFGLEPGTKEFHQAFNYSGPDDEKCPLNPRKLRMYIGDVEKRSADDITKDGIGESAFKGMLTTMLFAREFEPAHLAQMKEQKGITPRLNAVIDEPEQSMEYLELTKAVAAHLGVQCRIVAVPNEHIKYNDGTTRQVDLATEARFVDLDEIHVNDDNTVSYDYTQGGAGGSDKSNVDQNETTSGHVRHVREDPSDPTSEKVKSTQTGPGKFKNTSVNFHPDSTVDGGWGS